MFSDDETLPGAINAGGLLIRAVVEVQKRSVLVTRIGVTLMSVMENGVLRENLNEF